MTKGRPSLGVTRVHVLLRQQDLDDLDRYYHAYGMRTQIIRALVSRHVRRLNERVGRKVSIEPDAAEAHLIAEEIDNGRIADSARSSEQSDGRSGPGSVEHSGEQDSGSED